MEQMTVNGADNHFIEVAIHLALDNVKHGSGGPFGAIVVKEGIIIATGSNQVTTSNDPTAHAEVLAIRSACLKLETFQLTGCTVYSSCEPCPMCLGALYWARCDRIVFAANAKDAEAYGFDDSYIYEEMSRSYNERHRACDYVPHTDRLAPFQAWDTMQLKIPY